MKLAKSGPGAIFSFSEFQLNLLCYLLAHKASPTTYAQVKNEVGKRCVSMIQCVCIRGLGNGKLSPFTQGLAGPKGNG